MDFQDLRILNNTKLEYIKSLGKSGKRNQIIKEILEDEACFFKMTKDVAYIVLKDIGITDDSIEDIYVKLTSPKNYFELLKRNKIQEENEEIIIKY